MATPQILVADDDLGSCLILRRWAERLGFKCDIATNGAEAMAASQVNSYRIIFMDNYMPFMNGWEASIEITQRTTGVQFPVIVGMISIDNVATRQQCRDSGMSVVICKPISNLSFVNLMANTGSQIKPSNRIFYQPQSEMCGCEDPQDLWEPLSNTVNVRAITWKGASFDETEPKSHHA